MKKKKSRLLDFNNTENKDNFTNDDFRLIYVKKGKKLIRQFCPEKNLIKRSLMMLICSNNIKLFFYTFISEIRIFGEKAQII